MTAAGNSGQHVGHVLESSTVGFTVGVSPQMMRASEHTVIGGFLRSGSAVGVVVDITAVGDEMTKRVAMSNTPAAIADQVINRLGVVQVRCVSVGMMLVGARGEAIVITHGLPPRPPMITDPVVHLLPEQMSGFLSFGNYSGAYIGSFLAAMGAASDGGIKPHLLAAHVKYMVQQLVDGEAIAGVLARVGDRYTHAPGSMRAVIEALTAVGIEVRDD